MGIRYTIECDKCHRTSQVKKKSNYCDDCKETGMYDHTEDVYDIEETDLDILVHDAASDLATKANNNGVHGQIEFLKVVCGWSDEDIFKEVSKIV